MADPALPHLEPPAAATAEVMRRLFSRSAAWLAAALVILALVPVAAHEFWVSPSQWILESGARATILAQAVKQNERALELANVRFRVGSGDLRAVQQQQLAVYGARTSLVRVRSEQLVQRVNLYLALGGGWTN